jgi:outer membrane lipoprotein SlyB
MQARYYDPVIGRFYSNDPVDMLGRLAKPNGFQGFNRYTYAINNPYKYTDPDGKAWSWAAVGIGAIGGAAAGAVSSIISLASSDDPISWRLVATHATTGVIGGFVAGAIVGAATGDPTAIAVASVIGTTTGAAATSLLNETVDIVVEEDVVNKPSVQGRYRTEDSDQRDQKQEEWEREQDTEEKQ